MSEQPTEEYVVLLDEHHNPVGHAPKADVHTERTPLHLAFSSHVLNAQGEVLMTRRALSKKTWPGVWTNSFCGHPGPGERFEDAITRRAHQELGLEIHNITCVLPEFQYRATDASGVVENEYCPVFVATTDDTPTPVKTETAELAWIHPQDLIIATRHAPFAFSPWLVSQIAEPALQSQLG